MKVFDRQVRPETIPMKIGPVALFGEFGPPMLTAARSFRAAGIESVVMHLGRSPRKTWSSAVKLGALLQPEDAGTPAGLAAIGDFLRRTKAQALLPFWDPQILWLTANRHALPQRCKLLAPSEEALLRVQSKRDQLRLAQDCGFHVLPTWELNRREDLRNIDPTAYPVCLRPSLPDQVRPTFKVELLRSPVELEAFLDGRTWGPEPLLVQSFLPTPTILIHGVRSEAGELLALEAFESSMKFEGLSLELRPAPMDARLAQCCRRFLDLAGISGPFHFEFLHCAESSRYYYLEINVRLGGTTDKVFRMGFDEPLLALSAYGFLIPNRRYLAASDRPVINRRSVVKHIRSVIQGHLSPLDYPVAGAWQHLRLSLGSLLRSRDSIASARDLRGTWLLYRGGPR